MLDRPTILEAVFPFLGIGPDPAEDPETVGMARIVAAIRGAARLSRPDAVLEAGPTFFMEYRD